MGGGALTATGRTGRRPAAPRFKIRPSGSLASAAPPTSPALFRVGGGASSSAHPMRYRGTQLPRVRMRNRRGDGMLGGLLAYGPRRTSATRPATPRFRSRPLVRGKPMTGKRPRFRYRRPCQW